MMPPIDTAWIALFGTLLGGVGLKVTEHWLGRNKTNSEDAREIREELRLQIASQRDEIQRLEDEVDEWRTKYLDLRDEYVKVQTKLTIALQRIKLEAEDSQRKLDTIAKDNPPVV